MSRSAECNGPPVRRAWCRIAPAASITLPLGIDCGRRHLLWKEPGEHTFELCREYVDDIVTVTDDEIAAAILAMMEQEKLVAEGCRCCGCGCGHVLGKVPVKAGRWYALCRAAISLCPREPHVINHRSYKERTPVYAVTIDLGDNRCPRP